MQSEQRRLWGEVAGPSGGAYYAINSGPSSPESDAHIPLPAIAGLGTGQGVWGQSPASPGADGNWVMTEIRPLRSEQSVRSVPSSYAAQKFGGVHKIKLEVMSQWGVRGLFLLFMLVNVARIVVMLNLEVVWRCNNVCGSTCVFQATNWTSQACMQVSNNALTWSGHIDDFTYLNLDFFTGIYLATHGLNHTNSTTLLFSQTLQAEDLPLELTFHTLLVTCIPNREHKCALASFQPPTKAYTGIRIQVTLHDPPEWIDRDRTQLMLLSHDPRYTLVEAFFRSVLFVGTLCVLCSFGFLIGARPSQWLPEQGWLLGLLFGLLVYLDPVYLGYVLNWSRSHVALFTLAQYSYVYAQYAFQWVLLQSMRASLKRGGLWTKAPTIIALLWMCLQLGLDLALWAKDGADARSMRRPSHTDIYHSADDVSRLLRAISYGLMSMWMLAIFLTLILTQTDLRALPYLATRYHQLALVFYCYLQG
mmetsp:Transcript_207/g.560  ORF Transcript_207/g.560 Transcript_207/m.560 type:complete len:476 (-) Transcript_207:17-1444(-)